MKTIICGLILLIINNAFAKRLAPENVEPIRYNGMIIIADQEKMGFIKVFDTNQNFLWKKRIYTVDYIIGLERDVQNVYINKIQMHRGLLIIKNEERNYYSLDLDTRKVKKLKKTDIKRLKSDIPNF